MPGKDHTNYYYVRFSAEAELQGERIDIAGLSVTYTLDNVPTAMIYPTVGREPSNNKEAKAVDKLLAAQPFTPIKLYATFETDKDNPSDDPGFPIGKETLLFDGYVTGVTYQTSRNPAGGWVSLTVGAIGWLIGLSGSVAQTNANTIKGPGSFAELTNLDNGDLQLFNIKQAFVADGAGIATDLWVDYIKPFFQQLLDTPSVWGDSPNDSAFNALSKMDNEKVFSGDATNALPFRVGETAAAAGFDVNFVEETFGQTIGKVVYGWWRRADLLTALRNLALMFKFSIVPLISTASCVPFYPALKGEAHRYITTNDYHTIMIDVKTPVKIVKVVLTGLLGSSAFASTPVTGAIVGIHSAESAWADPELGARGTTIVQKAPPWLAPTIPIGIITRDSFSGDKLLIPDAVNPTANVKVPEKDYQDVYNKYLTSDLGDRLAQYIAQRLLFEERSGTIGGRFRMDIGPGSMIKVQVIDDKFSEEGADEKALYGHVNSVVLDLNAGKDGSSGSATTQLFVKYVRTAAEHELPGTALTSSVHPLYNESFKGVKLWSE